MSEERAEERLRLAIQAAAEWIPLVFVATGQVIGWEKKGWGFVMWWQFR